MSRFGYVMVTYLMTFWVIITAFFHPHPHIIWNASASVPTGPYLLQRLDLLAAGDLVAVKPSTSLAAYMAERRYLPLNTPLLKHLGALPGQTVCRDGFAVRIDGKTVAMALARDHLGRPLPIWSGCRTLKPDQVFLLNARVPDSFDGRYFGPVPMSWLIGRAAALFGQGED
jgi:conjugative transfer signal peptidase TraF